MKQPAEILTEPQKKKRLLEKNLGCGEQGLGAGCRLMICTARKGPGNGGGRAEAQHSPEGTPGCLLLQSVEAPRGRVDGGNGRCIPLDPPIPEDPSLSSSTVPSQPPLTPPGFTWHLSYFHFSHPFLPTHV